MPLFCCQKAVWSEEVAADKPARVTLDVLPVGDDACKLVLTRDDFAGSIVTGQAA
ncbi:hypothetical protein D9M68_538240 [compost metagenome]|nr:hypothetical protein OBG92_04543 [Pseudomonas aeruginosa]